MVQMVVSYRTADGSDTLTNLLRLITTRFGETNVCSGVDHLIELGDDRIQAITHGIKDCQLILLVVGRQWRAGSTWLSDPTSADRIAIETALREKTRIIPVLLDGATLLDAGSLPPEVEALGRRTGIDVHTETFQADSERLCEFIQKVIAPVNVPPISTAPMSSPDTMAPPVREPIIASGNQFGVQKIVNQSGLAIGTALTIPFRGEGVVTKLLTGALINLIPFFGQIITLGYGIRIAERIKQNEPGLPEWNNWGGDLQRGFVVFLAFILYGIIFSVASAVMAIIPFVGELLLLLLFVPVTAIATIRYVSERRFSAFFDFSAIFSFLTKNTTNALMLCLDGLILSFATFMVMSFTSILTFALLFVPSLSVFGLSMILYFSLVGVWVKRLTV